jgi:hypothetical protein
MYSLNSVSLNFGRVSQFPHDIHQFLLTMKAAKFRKFLSRSYIRLRFHKLGGLEMNLSSYKPLRAKRYKIT